MWTPPVATSKEEERILATCKRGALLRFVAGAARKDRQSETGNHCIA